MKRSTNTIWRYGPGWTIAIVLVLLAWPGLAQTRFASERVIKILSDERPRGLWLEDMDMDGDIDILFTTYGVGPEEGGGVAWMPNHGNLNFGEPILIDSNLLGTESINTADLNGDGLMDLVVTVMLGNMVLTYDNLGGGNFGPREVIDSTAQKASYAKAADFDGDGDLDIVSATENESSLLWYENDGGGNFGTEHLISNLAGINRFVWTEDLDLDGDIDVLASTIGTSGQIYLFLNTGDGTFATGTQLTNSPLSAYKWIHTQDMDGDGDPEILSTCYNSGEVFVFENLGNAVFGPRTVWSTNNDGARFTWTGDLDNDGDLDVVAASEFARRFSWAENLGGMTFGPEQVVSIKTAGPNEIYPADIDGDGDLDLVATCAYPGETSRIVWFEQLQAGDAGVIQFNEFYFNLEDPALYTVGPDAFNIMTERNGLLQSLQKRFATPKVNVFQDLRPIVQRSAGTAGLVDMVLDPGYMVNGYVYVAYETPSAMLRLSRFGQAGLPPNSPNFVSSELVLIEVALSGLEPNMALAFGTDGYLYVSVGDGWHAGNPTNAAADLADLRGKVLRLDVNSGTPYAIPPDNPYVATPGAQPEIWMTGIHQALGIFIDAQTGDLWLVDRGTSLWDEVHRFAAGTGAGANLGWPGWEGTDSIRSGAAADAVRFPDAVLPVQGLTGGVLYRGSQIPLFENNFVAFSSETGMLFAFQDIGSGIALTNSAQTKRPGMIDLAQDERMELVATDAIENKFLYFMERCSSETPPGKLYADAYNDGRVNYNFEPLPDATQYEVSFLNLGGATLQRRYIVTNFEKVSDVPLNRTYLWRVRAQCFDGTITPYSNLDTIVMPPAMLERDYLNLEEETNTITVVYPNTESAWISTNAPWDNAELRVYDLQGRLVFVQHQINNWPVTVSHRAWAAGLYIIQINGQQESITSRMLVQH